MNTIGGNEKWYNNNQISMDLKKSKLELPHCSEILRINPEAIKVLP